MKLRIKFTRVKNTVSFEILEQPGLCDRFNPFTKRIDGYSTFFHNGFILVSNICPDMTATKWSPEYGKGKYILFLKGINSRSESRYYERIFSSREDAIEYVKMACNAVRGYNRISPWKTEVIFAE